MDWNSSSSKNNNPPFLSHHHHHHHPSSQFSSNNFHHNFNHFGPFPGFLEAKYHEGTPVEMMGTPNIIPPNIEMMRDHMISMSYGVNNQDKMKKRLTAKQLDSLESSFQEERKLDPDRKMKLARDLGLQPRQIAVWFQNRRARWKSKKLEHLYDALKHDFDVVSKEKQKLQDEVQRLKCMLMEQATTRKQMHSGYTEASCEETVESTSVADLNNANNDEEDNNNNDDDDNNNNNNNRAAAAAAAGVIFSRDQNKVGGHYHHLFNNVDVYNAISPSYWGALA